MLRKIRNVALFLLGLILLLAIAAVIYIRSGGLDNILRNQIIAGLKDAGIRAELGHARLDITGSKVTFEKLELYAEGVDKPFALVERIEGEFSVISYLAQRINLTKLTIVKPEVWIEIDEGGQTVLDKLKSPADSGKPKDERLRFFTATYDLQDAKIHLNDRKNRVTADIANLTATLTPRESDLLEDKLNHVLAIGFNKSSATYEGREIHNIALKLDANITESSADIESLTLNSDVVDVYGNGQISSFEPITYRLKSRPSWRKSVASLRRIPS
jgi:uncharacterized protein involved in outer membrane biogenesis